MIVIPKITKVRAISTDRKTQTGVARKVPKALPRAFFSGDPKSVGRALLGKLVVRRLGKKTLVGRIVEVEAYLGENDPAAHSAAGRTARNSVLFGPPGSAYVYFIYGNYYCLNVSCEPDGKAGGVLIRALEPVAGVEEMVRLRGVDDPRKLTSGPGRLAEALGITRDLDNGKDLTDPKSDLFMADDGYRVKRVVATARIGLTKAADLPLRFLVEGNEFVSGKKNQASGFRRLASGKPRARA